MPNLSPPAKRKRGSNPPELARRYGVCDEKVIGWILSGELPAINIATKRDGVKARYFVPDEAIEAFERSRAVTPSPEPAPKPRRSSKSKWY